MNSNILIAASPLAAYVGSFMSSSAPVWLVLGLAVVVQLAFLVSPPVMILGYLERKFSADIQMRIGPNRVKPAGLFQGVADAIKLFFKEDAAPKLRDALLFRWGAVAAVLCLLAALSDIPMARDWALANLESGAVWAIATLIFSNLCLFAAAYSANSQWSVLSAYRILAMVSAYVVPVAIASVAPVMIVGSTNLGAIVRAQGGAPWNWIAFHDPGTIFSCVAFFLALMIWQGRVPFDHYLGRSEVGGGFESEFSGLRKGYLAIFEYASVFLSCALVITLYFGGWRTPFNLASFGRAADLVQWLFFMVKAFVLVFISLWVRWSLPRMRIDQIIDLCWQVLVPAGILGTAIVSVWLVVFHGKSMGGLF